MLTQKELDYLDYLLEERLPKGKRTACARLEDLGFGVNTEQAEQLLQRLAMRGLIHYQAPLEPGGYAIITRREPPRGGALVEAKRRKPRTAVERILHDPAPRGA